MNIYGRNNDYSRKKLYDYVRNPEECQKNEVCCDAISKLIRDEGQIVKENEEVIVYRGQYHNQSIYTSIPWFSVSKTPDSTTQFRGETCCFFIIHIMPGTQYLDVNKSIQTLKFSNRMVYKSEDEILLPGRGYFYTSPTNGIAGFVDKGNGVYESWYSMVPIIAKKKTNPVAKKTPVTLNILKERAAENGFDNESNVEFLKIYLSQGEILQKGGRHFSTSKTRKRKNLMRRTIYKRHR